MHTMQYRGSLMCDYNYSSSKVEAFITTLVVKERNHVCLNSFRGILGLKRT